MILVTGASGTVGSEVVRALGAVKSRVRAGYRTRPQNVPEGVESVALDYDRPNTLRPALKDVDTLFLVSNSITPELTVVDEARHAGVKRIVKLSVLNAAEEGYTFARWHRLIEKHIEASGLEWTFLRSNGFMQNIVTYMGETIRTQSAFYSSGGNGAASHVDARDLGAVAASVLLEMGHEGQAYELTGPSAITYGQIAETLSGVLGRPIRYVPISHQQYKQALLGAGTPEPWADALADLSRYYAEGHAAGVSPAVRRVTGRDVIPFTQFARDYASQLR
jgi:uncharacterized protein YbjT (DUF2867 family)